MPVEEIRRAAPLTDVPGRLRLLADKIDAGEYEADLCCVVVRSAVQPGTYPRIHTFAYGNYLSPLECDGLMLMATRGGPL